MSDYKFLNLRKFRLLLLTAVIVGCILFSNESFSQSEKYNNVSDNTPFEIERVTKTPSVNSSSAFDSRMESLEKKHKEALEQGRTSDAKQIQNEVETLLREGGVDVIKSTPGSGRFSNVPPEENGNDWSVSSDVLFPGEVHENNEYNHIDYKFGEDNVLYAVINRNEFTSIIIYKSVDFGRSWLFVGSIYFTGFISGVSITVESKQNLVADSTRIIVFYTLAEDIDNVDGSLNCWSIRSNGTASKNSLIGYPPSGFQYNQLSAVSDGAFYALPTYYGVVCSEVNAANSNVSKLRFFRTVDWGETWIGTSLATGFNDFYPSASYKEGSSDSIYIAVERRFGNTNSQIRVIATKWIPTPDFYTYYLTSNSLLFYKSPQLAIKQKVNADSMIITCTKDNKAVYHARVDNSSNWNIDYTLDPLFLPHVDFAVCSSSSAGPKSFTACWTNYDDGKIYIRKGNIGAFGDVLTKEGNISPAVLPKCVNIYRGGNNFTSYIYAGGGQHKVYVNSEGTKQLTIKGFSQGYYNTVKNHMVRNDTLRVFIRNSFAPYSIIDSSKGILDTMGICEVRLANVPDGKFYIHVKHRNCLETWSDSARSFSSAGDNYFDFTYGDYQAYGKNQVSIDASPSRYGFYSGETNDDGNIDLTDLIKIYNDASNFVTGNKISDITGDNVTDLTDVVMTANNVAAFVKRLRP